MQLVFLVILLLNLEAKIRKFLKDFKVYTSQAVFIKFLEQGQNGPGKNQKTAFTVVYSVKKSPVYFMSIIRKREQKGKILGNL